MNRSSRVTTLALSALVGTAGLGTAASATAVTAPASGPAHGRLAFQTTSANGLPYSLATMDDTGTGYAPIKLSGVVPVDPRSPMFSHDGKLVAFIGSNPATNDLAVYVANADGSHSHIVVAKSPDQWHSINSVVWSADNSTLYLGLLQDANNEPIQLWQINVDGTGQQPEPVPGLTPNFEQVQPEVLADGRLAYSEGSSNDAVIFDPKTKTSTTLPTKLTGFLPFTLSPDGKRIAVIEPKNSMQALDVYNIDGTGLQTITTYQSAPEVPAWSPDSAELLYAQNGGYYVHDVTGTGPDTAVSIPAGVRAGEFSWIALQPAPPPTPTPTPTPTPSPTPAPRQPTVHRIGGDTRYDTSKLVSSAQWQSGQANAVVLARGDAAPDALAGVPFAAHVHGPLLLTNPAALDTATRGEIDRVLGGPLTHKKIYILGGNNAVSPTIESKLRSAGYTVIRYGGDSRYDTALQIAGAFGPTSHVIVATGHNFPDALSAGPLGAAENAPIVLSDDATLDATTAAFIAQHSGIDPVGGQAQKAVATLNTTGKTVNMTLAGTDRYVTSADVATRITQVLGHASATVGVASGTVFPDALTGGAFIANAGGALLLTNPASLSTPTRAVLSGWRAQLTAVEIFGGTSAVGGSPFASVVSAVGGHVI